MHLQCFLTVALAASLLFLSGNALPFGFDDVGARARQLAAAPYRKPENPLPRELQALTYDQYREIRFNPDRTLWRGAGLPFEVGFFHPGHYFGQPVRINEISTDGVREIRFGAELFNYGASTLDPQKMRNLGFAGFRIHFPVNSPKYKDEVLSFLGASYFRALGRNQRYGLSARALAIDTGVMSGEEFPHFVEFWLSRPAPADKEMIVYALLDSRRATGAYRFVLKPGIETAVEVRARLFFREEVGKAGLAPLTSMFYHGENQRPPADDARPEVHDSDGLSIQAANGEWIWRPLVNPRRLLVTSFAMTDPVGFGLMQRDRDFNNYQELDMRYELRPGAWVEPKGRWGAGRVELVQIPTPDETNDNIVAYWVPNEAPKPKQPYDLEYRLLWQKDAETRPALAWVTQTRRGRTVTRKPDGSISYTVDFAPPTTARPEAPVDAVVSSDANGEILESSVRRNELTGGWRLSLRVKRMDEKKPVELRAHLRSTGQTISELWSYIIPSN
jgi:glucans biosynthesis protein